MRNSLSSKSDKEKIKRSLKEKIFIYSLLLIPVLQFVIFYIIVKIDGIALAFQKYNHDTGVYIFAGFEQFGTIIENIKNGILTEPIKISLLTYVVGLPFFPTGIFVSFLIWRKMPLGGVFKIILFLPSILPGVVFTMIARYSFEYIFPQVLGTSETILNNSTTGFWTVIIYDTFMGFAGGLIYYLSAMSSTDIEVVEAGRLDGLGLLGEFWHVVLPHIYPTVSLFFVMGWTSIFMGHGSFFLFYGYTPKTAVPLGYVLFVETIHGANRAEVYPYLTAVGLVITAITVPVVLSVRKLVLKIGPSAD